MTKITLAKINGGGSLQRRNRIAEGRAFTVYVDKPNGVTVQKAPLSKKRARKELRSRGITEKISFLSDDLFEKVLSGESKTWNL